MSIRAPALFIGHGSPMNAIEDTPSTRGWADIAARFPKPRAVVVISAHWVTDGVRVTANAHPRTIHDFGRGFPQALFDQQYPAPGDPALAADIANRLSAFGAELDESWGLDHGAWSILKHMYPHADVPVVEVSLDAKRGPEQHYAIGAALAPLRDENVAIIGSGVIVHNLISFFAGRTEPAAWDFAFDDFVVDAVVANDVDKVLRYSEHPAQAQANPDWDHFFPIFYALAARKPNEQAHVFNKTYRPGLSMTSIAFGLPQ